MRLQTVLVGVALAATACGGVTTKADTTGHSPPSSTPTSPNPPSANALSASKWTPAIVEDWIRSNDHGMWGTLNRVTCIRPKTWDVNTKGDPLPAGTGTQPPPDGFKCHLELTPGPHNTPTVDTWSVGSADGPGAGKYAMLGVGNTDPLLKQYQSPYARP